MQPNEIAACQKVPSRVEQSAHKACRIEQFPLDHLGIPIVLVMEEVRSCTGWSYQTFVTIRLTFSRTFATSLTLVGALKLLLAPSAMLAVQ
jgi:hypothetical protein